MMKFLELVFHVSLRLTISIFASDKVYCDSYDCPDNYKLVDDADDVVCKDKKCTKDQCCEKGEVSPNNALREFGDETQCLKLQRKSIYLVSTLTVLAACS